MKTDKEIRESFESRDLEKAWETYFAQCYPPGFPQRVHDELHKTFFAGALVMYGMMLHATELEEDQAIKVLADLREQLDRNAAKHIG